MSVSETDAAVGWMVEEDEDEDDGFVRLRDEDERHCELTVLA